MPSTQIEIGQRQRREGSAGILLQAAVADFREAPQALNHGEDMFNPGPDLRFVTVLPALPVARNSSRRVGLRRCSKPAH